MGSVPSIQAADSVVRRTIGRWLRRCLFLLYIVILIEIGLKAFWYIKAGVPLTQPSQIIYAYHGEIKRSEVDEELRRSDDDVLDVLLLGGSVVSPEFGNIGERLEQRLAESLYRPVRVFNLASGGRTTLDSLTKYRMLQQHRFDLVVMYHGINESRMNNCPESVFRNDYLHCRWYREIDFIQNQGVTNYLLTPFTVYRTALDIIEEIPGTGIIPMQRPCHHWLDHGSVIKTEKTFRRNVEQLLTLTSQRQEPLVLMTFACYVPEDYSLQRFEEKKLDYASHRLPVEIWGNPTNVENSVNAHNRVVQTMAGSRNVTFVDQASIIPHSADFFNDCCHLTSKGCDLFVESIVDAIQRDSRLQLARNPTRSLQ